MSIQDLEVGGVYLVGLKYPEFLNDPSPVNSVPKKIEAWYTEQAAGQGANLGRIRRHICLVVRAVVNTGGSTVAVILLGTGNPRHPYRFLPWRGSPQLEYQPLHSITPNPADAFVRFPGYLNFTHAIMVRVLGLQDGQDGLVPGECYIKKHFVDQGQALQINVETNELQNIRCYHLQYWEGKRWSADGSDVIEDEADGFDVIEDEDEADSFDSDISKRLASNVIATKSYASVAALKAKSPVISTAADSTSMTADILSSETVTDPIHPITGDCFSTMIARSMLKEDVRATQVELMDVDFELAISNAVVDVPISGIFFPLCDSILNSVID